MTLEVIDRDKHGDVYDIRDVMLLNAEKQRLNKPSNWVQFLASMPKVSIRLQYRVNLRCLIPASASVKSLDHSQSAQKPSDRFRLLGSMI